MFLRGVGNNAVNPNNEPSVALYVDGVYMASPQANLLSFNNIERIEVLKGPQGTLFGRNATGGVIQVITRDPSLTDAALEMSAGYGNYDTVRLATYVSTPLSDTLGIDLAMQYESRGDGFGRNIPTGVETQKQKSFSIRSKTVWEPSAATRVKISADYGYFSTNTPPQHPNDVPNPGGLFDPPTDGFDNYVNFLPGLQWRRGGGAVEISQDFEPVRVVSISAYRVNNGAYLLDGDTGSANLVNADTGQRQTNFSQELQLMSPTSSMFDWMIGGYYFNGKGSFGDRGQMVTGSAFGNGACQ